MPDQSPQPIEYEVTTPKGLRGLWDRFSRLSRPKKILMIVGVIAVASGIVLLVRAQPGESAALTLSPQTATVSFGDTLEVKILLDTQGTVVGSARAIVTFDPAVLGITPADVIIQGGGASAPYPVNSFPVVVERSVSGNTVAVTAGNPDGVNGTGILFATLRFTPQSIRCSSNAPNNAGGACANESDCGGTDGTTTYCGGITVSVDQTVSDVLTLSDDPQDILTDTGTAGSYQVISGFVQPTTCVAQGGSVCSAESYCPVTPIDSDDYPYPPINPSDPVCCPQLCAELNEIVITNMTESVTVTGTNGIATLRWNTKKNSSLISGGSCALSYGVSSGPPYSGGTVSGITETSIGTYQTVLSNLAVGQRYHYQITCTLAPQPSIERSFLVGQPVKKLTLSNVAPVNVRSTTVDITWTTNLEADSFAFFDTGSRQNAACTGATRNCYGYATEASDTFALIFGHSLSLVGLKPNTRYYFRVSSQTGDPPAGQRAYSVEGTFLTTSGELEPDANTILRAQGDRMCTEWLECSSGVELVSEQNEIEELCFDRSLCRELDPRTGECSKPLAVPGAPDEYTLVASDPKSSSVDLLRQRSGYFKPSFTWTGFASEDQTIEGWRHIGDIAQRGEKVTIPNGAFELTEFGPYPWIRLNDAPTTLTNVQDQRKNNPGNRVLQVTGSVSSGGAGGSGIGGAYVPLGNGLEKNGEYVAAFDYFVAWKDTESDPANTVVDEKLIVKLLFGTDRSSASGEVAISLAPTGSASLFNDWQHALARLRIDEAVPDSSLSASFLSLAYEASSNQEYTLKVDNVRIEPVLEIRDETFAKKSCRMFANTTAIECDYIDEGTGRQVLGWKGFCLEPDPKDVNQEHCLAWWPVDILKGETAMFSRDVIAGYSGQFPLYYCLESSGNRNRNPGTSLGGYQVFNPYNRDFKQTHGDKRCEKYSPSKPYTFGICKDDKSTRVLAVGSSPNGEIAWTVPAGAVEDNIYEYDIEHVFVRAVWNWGSQYPEFIVTKKKMESLAVESSAGNEYRYQRLAPGPIAPIQWAVILQGHKAGTNGMVISLLFNEQGKFYGYVVNAFDDTGHEVEGAAYRVEFFLNEACRYVAQTVTPFGDNKAWVDRFSSGSWSKDDHNIIDYPYNFENNPKGADSGQVTSLYGAMIAPVGLPEAWPTPLSAEPPDRLLDFDFPYQARAGGPYSVPRPTQTGSRICTAGKIGNPCNDNIGCDETFTGIPYCDPVTYTCVNSAPLLPLVDAGQGSCVDAYGHGIYDNSDTGFDAACGGGICEDFCVRGGAAYCDIGDEEQGRDAFAIECVECLRSNDCTSQGQTVPGICSNIPESRRQQDIGKAFCISGSSDQIGKVCQTSADCGFSLSGSQGKCVGVNLTDVQIGALGGGMTKGAQRLQYLFARAYGVWQLERDTARDVYLYRQLNEVPGAACTSRGLGKLIESDACGWDIAAARRCSHDEHAYCFDLDNDGNYYEDSDCGTGNTCTGSYFATPPRVENILLETDRSGEDVTNKQARFDAGFGTVALRFNSVVDGNQLPLVRYTVYWGDETVSTVSNLKIFDRRETEKPHVLVHTYLCEGSSSPGWDELEQTCIFKPKIQIEDNWSWCNGLAAVAGVDQYSGDGSRCSTYNEYAGTIIVCPGGACAPNTPPVAVARGYENAGDLPVRNLVVIDDAAPSGTETVTLDASASSDVDPGAVLSYLWSTSIAGAVIDQPTSAVTTATFPLNTNQGIVTLTVSDGSASDTDTMTVTVNPPPSNQLPTISGFSTAVAGVAPLTVNFTAQLNDPDGDFPLNTITLNYGDGSSKTPPFPDMSGAGSISDTYIYRNIGTYIARLSVTDSDVDVPFTATADKSITVAVNPGPTVNLQTTPNPPQGNVPVTVTFTAAISDAQGDYPITYTLDYGDGASEPNQQITSATTITHTHTYATPGTYTVTLRATDSNGNPTTVRATVFANGIPGAPSSLAQSFNGSARTAENQLTNDNTPRFTFTISDPNIGQVVGYEIQIARDSGFTAFAGGTPYTWPGSPTNPNTVNFDVLSGNGLTDGSYWWRVRTVDSLGEKSAWVTFGNPATADFVVDVDWWDDQWQYRRKINLTYTGTTALTDVPVLVKLHDRAPNSRIDYTKTLTGGGDVRFVGTSLNLLDHEVETWKNSSNDSYVWVKVPRLDPPPNTANNYIYVYYGNPFPSAPPDPRQVWSNGYRTVWHMPGSGTTIVDSSPNGNNRPLPTSSWSWETAGRISNGVAWTPRDPGRGHQVSSGISDGQDLTIELWYKGSTSAPGSQGFDAFVLTSGRWEGLTVGSFGTTGNAPFYIDYTDYNNSNGRNKNTTDFGNGVHDYFVLTEDWNGVSAGTSQFIVYKNGVSAGTFTATNDPTPNVVSLGTESDEPQSGASIDELRASTVVRTADWVKTQYDAMQDTLISSFDAEEQRIVAGPATVRIAGARVERVRVFERFFAPMREAWRRLWGNE